MEKQSKVLDSSFLIMTFVGFAFHFYNSKLNIFWVWDKTSTSSLALGNNDQYFSPFSDIL